MAEERKAIHAYLTKPMHDVWHAVVEDEGISLSAFLEALAADFKEHPPAENHPRWKDIVRASRRLDADRRRRGRS